MNKTSIDWVKNPDGTQGYTWNPITGCLNGCEYCYARKLANTRLKKLYLANTNLIPPYKDDDGWTHSPTELAETLMPFYPRFWGDRISELVQIKRGGKVKPRGIFVCDMSDLFGIGIPENWTERVLEIVRGNWQDRFYLLTKQPQNLQKFSPFPDNCWVGVSATDDMAYTYATHELEKIDAKVKFISFEPLLQVIDCNKPWDKRLTLSGIKWVIIGAQTKPYKPPKIEWVQEIVEACDKAGVKVFLKNNLEPLWTLENRTEPFFKFSRLSPGATEIGYLRQELPNA